MTVAAIDLARYHDKVVNINVDTGKDAEGNDTFETVEGRVIAANDVGVIIRHRRDTRIIDILSILDIEEVRRTPRRTVVKRYVRVLAPDDSVRQHLADRHGVLVSVLNATDDDTARRMHEGYDHNDLGHKHGDRPVREVEQRMDELDSAEQDPQPESDNPEDD